MFFFLFSMYIAITSDIRFVIRILPDLERMEAAPVAQASSSRRQLGLAALAVAWQNTVSGMRIAPFAGHYGKSMTKKNIHKVRYSR